MTWWRSVIDQLKLVGIIVWKKWHSMWKDSLAAAQRQCSTITQCLDRVVMLNFFEKCNNCK